MAKPDGHDTLPPLEDETLDPVAEAGWEELRELGHRMVDQVVELHRGLRDGPAWRPVPSAVREALSGPLDAEGTEPEVVYDDFRKLILPYPMGNAHPRGWGWVIGSGTTLGAFAELLAAGMNPNCSGGDQASYYVEQQVLDTLKAALGWPADGSGLLTSGGSVANLMGIAAARDGAGVSERLGEVGLAALPRLVLYASEAVHNSVDKAVKLLGLGTDHLRRIPVDDEWRMDVAALRNAVARDREAGLRPFCVVATAGTVDHGAIDPLDTLADFCREQELWLHVDGAFGAVLALSEELRPLVRGIESADSVAFDLHKWLHVPMDAGCLLVRTREDHIRPFSAPASYLMSLERGVYPTATLLSDYGPQLSRAFRALKAWFALRVYGTRKLGRLVAQNVRQAGRLARLIREHGELELLAYASLNVICFRYRPTHDRVDDLDALNAAVLVDVQESGFAVISSTVVNGQFALRLAITNHRTRMEDMDGLVERVVEIGRRRTG